jgi:methylmalonyl-CoA mutase
LTNRAHAEAVSADLDPLEDLERSAELIRNAPPGFRPFAIHADEFLERGAGVIEEIGFAVSAALEFVDEVQTRGVNIDHATASLGFSFAIGPEFFVQIAKLRAFRLVWAQIVDTFGGSRESAKAAVYARTADWNQTVYDPHVNILRSTTGAVSAVLGGADSIEVAAFDECYKRPDESARRLARNLQLLLKQEAHLSHVADPVGGSYAIEVLTNSIATKAWKLFQDMEAAGGYRNAKAEGIVDSVLQKRERARQQAVDCRRLVLTGTNRFANAAEKALERTGGRGAGTAGVAHGFEELRLRTESAAGGGETSQILLAEIGDAKMRTARSQFAADFLACAGLSTKTKRFESAEQIAASDASLIVLCSSDPEYLPLAQELMPALKERAASTCVLIAGNPATAAQLTNLGIVEFIHLRSNAVEVLSRLQKQIGIEG